MRIGIDIRELEEGKFTGIGRFTLNFLNYVNVSDKENEYVLFGNQRTRQLNFSKHMKLRFIPEFYKLYWDQKVLLDQIKKEGLDIFFSPSYSAPIISKAKIIVTCHDLHFLNSSNPIANWLRQCYSRFIWERAYIIIAVSEYSKKEVIKFLGCSSEKVRIVYDSIERSFMPIDRDIAFEKLKRRFAKLNKDFILYVGNLKPHKNLSRLIQAYNLLPKVLKDRHQLVIVGKIDRNYSYLFYLVKKYNLVNNVVFLDLVIEDDLVYLYNAAAVLVLVSLHEGFGLPALEAMACGAPVIISNSTSLPEVVGDAGLYVNPMDVNDISNGLQIIITDESLRRNLSAKGLEQAKNFRVENSATKILEIFKEVKAIT
ncbi:MAG: glycosyltransferase family 1 protein [Candidatus Omnitrophota bacterium]|nr:glycosyltransferase family 1 protein [Candidatus Omnitrophota bacterium]